MRGVNGSGGGLPPPVEIKRNEIEDEDMDEDASEVQSEYSVVEHGKGISRSVEDPNSTMEGFEIEGYLENSVYRDILASRPVPKEITTQTIREENLKIESLEYFAFIEELCDKVESKSPDHFICLHCWRFVSEIQ